MERFMLFGEEYIVGTICHLLVRRAPEIAKIQDEFMLQKYLGRTMYQDSLERGEFFIDKF